MSSVWNLTDGTYFSEQTGCAFLQRQLSVTTSRLKMRLMASTILSPAEYIIGSVFKPDFSRVWIWSKSPTCLFKFFLIIIHFWPKLYSLPLLGMQSLCLPLPSYKTWKKNCRFLEMSLEVQGRCSVTRNHPRFNSARWVLLLGSLLSSLEKAQFMWVLHWKWQTRILVFHFLNTSIFCTLICWKTFVNALHAVGPI